MKEELLADLDEMMSKVHEGDGSKDFKTGMFRGFEAVKMLLERDY